MNGVRWYAFGRTQNLGMHGFKKLAIPRLVNRLKALYDNGAQFCLDNVDVGGLILKEPIDSNYLYVVGLLNSKLLDFYFRRISVAFRGNYLSANRQFIEPLPIRQIDLADPVENNFTTNSSPWLKRCWNLINKKPASCRAPANMTTS